mmetsp:Transcript_27508/g.94650  ORF Transcript_27508/g.94650 Transcript_27508/m.94650 type:complete len:238 (+) Transcript_27508:202-915(+)
MAIGRLLLRVLPRAVAHAQRRRRRHRLAQQPARRGGLAVPGVAQPGVQAHPRANNRHPPLRKGRLRETLLRRWLPPRRMDPVPLSRRRRALARARAALRPSVGAAALRLAFRRNAHAACAADRRRHQRHVWRPKRRQVRRAPQARRRVGRALRQGGAHLLEAREHPGADQKAALRPPEALQVAVQRLRQGRRHRLHPIAGREGQQGRRIGNLSFCGASNLRFCSSICANCRVPDAFA